MKSRTRSSAPDPLTQKEEEEEEEDHRTSSKLVTADSRFGLPDGWCVREIPRNYNPSRPTRVDRYYIESDTGQKFRSLVAVRRYLTAGQVDTHATIQITPQARRSSSSFVLPDGWEIEEKRKKNTSTCRTDKIYIEPGTGRRFRSLVAVERYLTGGNEHSPLQSLIPSNTLIHSSGSSSRKKQIQSQKPSSKKSTRSTICNSILNPSRLNTYSAPAEHFSSLKREIPPAISRPLRLNVSSQPPKVKWVLVDTRKNEWNPFMNDTRVADSVKEKWSEIFKSFIYDETLRTPCF